MNNYASTRKVICSLYIHKNKKYRICIWVCCFLHIKTIGGYQKTDKLTHTGRENEVEFKVEVGEGRNLKRAVLKKIMYVNKMRLNMSR